MRDMNSLSQVTVIAKSATRGQYKIMALEEDSHRVAVNVSIAKGAQPVVVTQSGSRSNTQVIGNVPAANQHAAKPMVYARPLSSLLTSNKNPRLLQALSNGQISHTTRENSSGQAKPVNLNVRVISPSRKSQYETYVLRNIGRSNISTPASLKEEIYKQFGSDVVSSKCEFPVGYIN